MKGESKDVSESMKAQRKKYNRTVRKTFQKITGNGGRVLATLRCVKSFTAEESSKLFTDHVEQMQKMYPNELSCIRLERSQQEWLKPGRLK